MSPDLVTHYILVNKNLYTFKFTQSVANFNVWTAPGSYRSKTTDTVPAATGNTLSVSCAREGN